MSNPTPPSFEIRTASDFFDLLVKPQYGDFLENNFSGRHALLSIITTYHMYEWVHHEKFSISSFCNKYPNDTALADDFDIARHITNGTKHCLTRVVTTTTQKGFSSEFTNEFARPLVITRVDSTNITADIFIQQLVEFWQRQKTNGVF